MKKVEKPIVEFDKKGESGNIFFILARVRDILRKQSRITEYNDLWSKVQLSNSYEEALDHIREYVTLVEKKC